MASSFIETIQKRKFLPTMPYKDELPISQSEAAKGSSSAAAVIGLRKRISSFSVRIQPLSSASTAWAFRKSKSMPSLGDFGVGGPLRRWWDWGWGWILSRKPVFARDVEMNEEEIQMLGCHSKGSLRHLFYKVRSELRRLVRSQTLPTTMNGQQFRYDSISYAHNFDDGKREEQ